MATDRAHPLPSTNAPPPDANPFSTARVRPGAIPYEFTAGQSLAELLATLEAHGGWGQIVGPHGSGKSTLLRYLASALEERGRRLVWFRIAPGQRNLPELPKILQATRSVQVLVDGYEQLSWWTRTKLRRYCRRQSAGLLVTAHADTGLPELVRAEVTLARVQSLVDQLLVGFPPLVNSADIRRCFERYPTNLREILFGLYDLYELRRRLGNADERT